VNYVKKKFRIGIAASRFNESITEKMVEAALARAAEIGIEVSEVKRVDGAFEIPFGCMQLLKKKNIDAVATLGAIITGGTDHDQVIAHSAAQKLLGLSVQFEKPVSLGIIGPRVSKKQALARAVPYAQRSVDAIAGLLGFSLPK
jgi:6,7-dimethyl-8-ribityllumazine synthase